MLASGIGRSQTERLWHDVGYGGSITATMGSGDNAPFWLTNNRQGLGNVDQGSIMVRAYVERDAKADSLRHWKVGYGLDLAAGCGLQSHFTLQQAYIDAGWKMLRLSVVLIKKERPPRTDDPQAVKRKILHYHCKLFYNDCQGKERKILCLKK